MRKPKSNRRKAPNYSQNKRAFDAVMEFLRQLGSPRLGRIGAVSLDNTGRGRSSSINPARHDPARPFLDFRCDVLVAVREGLPGDIDLSNFFLAYLLYDSEDAIEREKYAQKILHDRRHSAEQRIGAEFVRRGIYPIRGGYFR